MGPLAGIGATAVYVIGPRPAGADPNAGEKEETRPAGGVGDPNHRGDGSATDGRTTRKPPQRPPKKKPGLY